MHEGKIKASKKSKKPSSKFRSVLVKRDLLALRWVCEHGAMTVDQLWRAVWKSESGKNLRYAYARISFLEKAGFLKKLRSTVSFQFYYGATHRGWVTASTVLESKEGKYFPSPKVSLNLIPHLHVLTELRLAVVQSDRCRSWKTDRMLAASITDSPVRKKTNVPDALWVIEGSGKRVLVEYERTRKGASRLRSKINDYRMELLKSDRRFDQVLWIAEPIAYSLLKRLLKDTPLQFLRTYDEFMAEL